MVTTSLSARQLIDRLVGFDTTSRHSNLALIDFVADYLEAFGVGCDLIKDETQSKANLYATIGPTDRGGIMLSGHTDVVPVDGQNWSSDPFKIREADGRLYGRGTADMKSFIAVALSLVPEMAARTLRKPFHFALSYDEEVGCVGVDGIIAFQTQTGAPLPEFGIVGEPTSMAVVNAHKTCSGCRTTVRGLEGHSSNPLRGVNAIEAAAQAILLLQGLQADLRRENQNPAFEPPFTTFSVGLIDGGTAKNIIPNRCSFVWDIRALPGVDVPGLVSRYQEILERELVPALRAVHPEAGIEQAVNAVIPGLAEDAANGVEDLVKSLSGQNRSRTVAYATEAGKFQRAGIPAVVCGPGSIDQAHRADEFIDIAQVAACETFLRRVVDSVSNA